jgi:hypothetical protein
MMYTRKCLESDPLADLGGPQGGQTSRLPYFLDNRLTDGGEVVILTRQQRLIPGSLLVHISVRG